MVRLVECLTTLLFPCYRIFVLCLSGIHSVYCSLLMISVQSILRSDDPDLVAKQNFIMYPYLCVKE